MQVFSGYVITERKIARVLVSYKDASVIAYHWVSSYRNDPCIAIFDPTPSVWLLARFVAGGVAVAGIFVDCRIWLPSGDESQRAKRLGVYVRYTADLLLVNLALDTLVLQAACLSLQCSPCCLVRSLCWCTDKGQHHKFTMLSLYHLSNQQTEPQRTQLVVLYRG